MERSITQRLLYFLIKNYLFLGDCEPRSTHERIAKRRVSIFSHLAIRIALTLVLSIERPTIEAHILMLVAIVNLPPRYKRH